MENASVKEVARLRVAAERRHLSSVVQFVRSMGLSLGLDERRAGELEHAVDEAITNVIQHAFEQEGAGEYSVIISRWPGQVQVAIEDQGLPFDLDRFRVGDGTGLGHQLLKRYADEVRFYNRGAAGKRLELFKHLPADRPELFFEDQYPDEDAPSKPSDEPVEIRPLGPDEALALTRCVFRVHGYDYAEEQLYYPDQVREYLESGRLVSVAAMTYGGEVAAHVALRLEDHEAMAAEIGIAMVDPRFVGRGLRTDILERIISEARSRGLAGLWGLMGCSGIEMQKAALNLGFKEAGILLASSPTSGGARQSGILFYLALDPDSERSIYAPMHHQGLITSLFESCGLHRKVMKPEALSDLPERSFLDLKLQPEWGRAVLTVSGYGRDLKEQVAAELKGLCLRGLPCIYLDLPLNQPAIQSIAPELEMMGFFLAGILPESGALGDYLRMQYLNNVVPEQEPQLASDLARELWNYVAAGR
jgi:anti-sigma regulatory factor (Ser/Thr protein kinase)/GNAT superfamily N-acetyltransferase